MKKTKTSLLDLLNPDFLAEKADELIKKADELEAKSEKFDNLSIKYEEQHPSLNPFKHWRRDLRVAKRKIKKKLQK